MQTHDDNSHLISNWFQTIQERAAKMVAARESEITAGREGETAIREQEVDDILIRRMPDDPLCLRVSIGEGITPTERIAKSAYFVFRGDANRVADLLERAAKAFREWGR